MYWEPGRTTPTVVTLLCDFLCHTVTLRPSEEPSGSSHLDVTDHTWTDIYRPVSPPSRGTTLMRSQKGVWTRSVNDIESPRNFVTFSTDDVRHTGTVRLDVSKVGMRGHQVIVVNFDEVSGRIILLAGGPDGSSCGFIVDMPRM